MALMIPIVAWTDSPGRATARTRCPARTCVGSARARGLPGGRGRRGSGRAVARARPREAGAALRLGGCLARRVDRRPLWTLKVARVRSSHLLELPASLKLAG